MDTHSTDFAVVGLGAVGAATLYQLAKRGAKVIGIDRYSQPHNYGSSHGHARVTRTAVGEGSCYVPLVRRSQEIIGELERNFNAHLMGRTGTLIIGSERPAHGDDFVKATVDIAVEHGIHHTVLSSTELERQYPQLIGLTENDYGYFEPDAGFLRPEPIISLQLDAARRSGAAVVTNSTVEHISQEDGCVTISCGSIRIKAKHAVISAGRWAAQLLGAPFDDLLAVSKQRTYSFKPLSTARYDLKLLPALMWFRSAVGDQCITAFPQGAEDHEVNFFVEGQDLDVGPSEAAKHFYQHHIRPFFGGISSQMVGSGHCYYTNTSDGGFIIDRHPHYDQLLVLSACSGHGFKHSLAVGELAAELLVDGKPSTDLAPFSLQRFKAPPAGVVPHHP
ncbi:MULTISPECIES: N-methyl-L-tryptophan oxidase [Rhizobium/Agrobacterium group]|uniref:N-methyl-L-tryptophan oxidase n=1 Tax=Rhizobium/Agrobacterium group TaxID=227290 RepID=UPI0008DBF984|nr:MULTISPECIES: N-methyl-L-tryptophan oxidase [Rhizobium/Agrobacterium group]MCF1436516.1 N-methyl-L-tryptophan oxidase [Allorhizobium ampelinum]MCF1464465.1 N-methyl-L-tryptophan oxidase [Allorhizobium ampelinum]MCF1495833.1 N-methyl-L-tryptophan oxidase [Allorhizobium ampelinum]MUO91199.1 N-methyl-L-tryptophan oxidase [Agrobacterium vitis]MUZ54272.1 N-methyl-L-tryptophan oxidase [Agrobacterium vitis]